MLKSSPSLPAEAAALLEFWFADCADSVAAAEARADIWFGQHADFDAEIHRQFGDWPARAAAGEFAHWQADPHASLALVLCLDQLPRNLFRGTPRAFAHDARARAVADAAVAAGHPAHLHPLPACFFYLPYEHAEDLAWQTHCVPGYRRQRDRAEPALHRLLDMFIQAGEEHRDTVVRFGRFPHRNAILGRSSTAEETAYLAGGAKTYGQTPPR
jgi:uncharacterized protein (DUF924 family)